MLRISFPLQDPNGHLEKIKDALWKDPATAKPIHQRSP